MPLPTFRFSVTLLQLGTAVDPACCCENTGESLSEIREGLQIGFTSELAEDE